MTDIGATRMTAPINAIPADFEFTDAEAQGLATVLSGVKVNPYRCYEAFMLQVNALIPQVPQRFAEFVATLAARDRAQEPWFLIRNAPTDRDVPIFDYEDPVKSKHDLKKTFVAEAFLALFAFMRQTPPIGYINVNDGDVFQDIYPKRAMASTQSQKALNEIYFHKDLANHFVRPDHVYMLGMRSDPANEVYTSFVRNIDVLAAFSDAEQEVLRSKEFYTPFDDLTVAGAKRELGDADRHPILSDDNNIRVFENRTRGLTPEAERLVVRLVEVLHQVKQRHFISPGDFMGVNNNYAVHAKEVVSIENPDTLRCRWIIKTVNVDDLKVHQQHMIPGTAHLVNG